MKFLRGVAIHVAMDYNSWFCNTTSRKPACFGFRGRMMIKASLLIPSYHFPILEDRQLTPFIVFKCINIRRAHAAASWHSSNSGVVLRSYYTPSEETAKRHTPSPRAWHSCFLFSSISTSRLTPELAAPPLPYSSLFTSLRSTPRTASLLWGAEPHLLPPSGTSASSTHPATC